MPKAQQQPMRPPTPFERLADPDGRRRAADPRLTANGAVRANRAAQFMPFAALTGYYELVRKQEISVEPKCELTEEKALELSEARGPQTWRLGARHLLRYIRLS